MRHRTRGWHRWVGCKGAMPYDMRNTCDASRRPVGPMSGERHQPKRVSASRGSSSLVLWARASRVLKRWRLPTMRWGSSPCRANFPTFGRLTFSRSATCWEVSSSRSCGSATMTATSPPAAAARATVSSMPTSSWGSQLVAVHGAVRWSAPRGSRHGGEVRLPFATTSATLDWPPLLAAGPDPTTVYQLLSARISKSVIRRDKV